MKKKKRAESYYLYRCTFVFSGNFGNKAVFILAKRYPRGNKLYRCKRPPPLPASTAIKLFCCPDIHGKVFGEDNAPLYKAIEAQQADMLCIAGDLVDEGCSGQP